MYHLIIVPVIDTKQTKERMYAIWNDEIVKVSPYPPNMATDAIRSAFFWTLLLSLLKSPAPTEQCMRTGGTGPVITTTAAPATPCNNPANTEGIILDVNPASQINSMDTVVGTCPCSNGLTRSYFNSQPSANQPSDIASVDVQCADMANFCVCDISGVCYTRMGALTDVQFYSFCTGGVCRMYTVLIADNNADGVVSTTGTQTFTFGQQLDASGNPLPFSPNDNIYLHAASVSCSGCTNIQGATCMGPFTATG
ncbi:hypothetical protein Ddc_05161 [Ditylenchus destructor]|nr:hypothetical protein Ddc_05161 [Ditylenchus destructor]